MLTKVDVFFTDRQTYGLATAQTDRQIDEQMNRQVSRMIGRKTAGL
jgi:hypothetical protein